MSHLGLCHSNISNDSPFSIQDFCWSAMYSRWKNLNPSSELGHHRICVAVWCIGVSFREGLLKKRMKKTEVVFCFMTCHLSRCLPASSQYQWTQSNIWTIGFQYSLRFSGKKHLAGWCSTPTQLLICSSFNRENGHPLLICLSLSTAQHIMCPFSGC